MPAKSAGDALRHAFASSRPTCSQKLPFVPCEYHTRRDFHCSEPQTATPLPVGLVGPPPGAPLPAATQYGARVDRLRKQAEMLRQAKEPRAKQNQNHNQHQHQHQNQHGKHSALKKRFWKHVDVKESPEGYQIFLDARPVRTPNKSILTLPPSKPHLAHAIALEWDLLTSAQQALKSHNIPLTSLASRADDIEQQESQGAAGSTRPRDDILNTVMRHLDTDTLLCWAPAAQSSDSHHSRPETRANHPTTTESLRDIQRRTAQPILSYLTTRVWPGTELHPILDESSILPGKQPEMTKNIIRGWVSGLPAYELAALERGVLASKSLLVATRLLVEWGEEFRHLHNGGGSSFARGGVCGENSENPRLSREDEAQDEAQDDGEGQKRFGIEEAAEACSTEVRWQTRVWGEVEDTHDVEREDLRMQLGSVVVLVSGNR